MARRYGTEKYLLEELHCTMLNKPLPNWPNKGGVHEFTIPEYNDPAKSIGGSGSNNWATIAQPTRLKHWINKPFVVPDILELAEANRNKWEGKEIDSTIYDSFVGHSHLCMAIIAREIGNEEVLRQYRDICRYRAARYALYWSARHRRTIGVGQRSAGGPMDGKSWMEWYYRVGMLQERPPAGYMNAKFRPMASLLYGRDEILLAFADMREGRKTPYEILAEYNWKSVIPVYFMLTDQGNSAVFMLKNIHQATQPVLVGVNNPNGFKWGPSNRGGDQPNLHRKKGQSSVVVDFDDRVFKYTSAIYRPQRIPMPLGNLSVYVQVSGPDGFRNLLLIPLPLTGPPIGGLEPEYTWYEKIKNKLSGIFMGMINPD